MHLAAGSRMAWALGRWPGPQTEVCEEIGDGRDGVVVGCEQLERQLEEIGALGV
jgi:hypothetical protein